MTNDILLDKKLLRQCTPKHVGYEWTGNSCYIDSVLWVLFSSPFSFVDNKILFPPFHAEKIHRIASCKEGLHDLNEKIFLEFQMCFRKIAYYFRCGVGNQDCSMFRKLYKKWHQHPQCSTFHSKTPFHSTEQQEAQEFLQFILSLYGMNGQENYGAVSIQRFYYGVSKVPRIDTLWKYIYERKDKTQSLVWNVSYSTLRNTTSQQRSIKNFLQHQDEVWNITKKHKNCDFNAMKTIHQLVKFSNLLVISLERAHPIQETISHYRIRLNQTLTDEYGKKLWLTSIICHHGETATSGHYTAFNYSITDGQWYYYDDMNLPIQKIGSWEDMMTIRQIQSHCVLIFYRKL